MTKVTIIDQRQRFRDLVAAALTEEGFTVEWPDRIERWTSDERHIAIIDLTTAHGLDLLARLKKSPTAAVVLGLVDGHTALGYAEALQRGAANVVSKQAHPHLIVDAVHATLTGRVVLPASVVNELTQTAAAPAARPCLSQKDLKLLRLMAAGLPMTKIARELHVSERTVYREAKHLLSALGATTRAEGLVRAAQWGFLANEPFPHA